MISWTTKGSFANTEKKLKKLAGLDIFSELERYGAQGVAALRAATPVDSGITAESWDYTIRRTKTSYEIIWTNSHVVRGVPIAIILQYGHGTGTGGYVAGRDYINPAMKPIFEEIKAGVRKVVQSA